MDDVVKRSGEELWNKAVSESAPGRQVLTLMKAYPIKDPPKETLLQLAKDILDASVHFGDRTFNKGDRITIQVVVEYD